MKKLVHAIITHQSFAPGIKGGEYYYCDGIDREINKAMQEPLKKLYKYENQPDMREKIAEYISELDAEIDRCTLLVEENMNGDACMISEIEGRLKALTEVKNDLQGRLNEII